jgi:hypothetical protein
VLIAATGAKSHKQLFASQRAEDEAVIEFFVWHVLLSAMKRLRLSAAGIQLLRPVGTTQVRNSVRIGLRPPSTNSPAAASRRSFAATIDGNADGPRVGIVGTGPAAFYTAKYLLKELPTARVDMFDALPTPYGLVRFGVAPDHPEVKLVQNDFALVASDPRSQFFGNVKVSLLPLPATVSNGFLDQVGTDITIPEMRKFYNALVLAYGAGA